MSANDNMEGAPIGGPPSIPAAAMYRPLRGQADEFAETAGHDIPPEVHNFAPGRDFLLVIRRKPSEKTAGGLVKPHVQENLTDGLVFSAGPEAHYSGFDPIDLIGRRILFGFYCGTGLPLEDDSAGSSFQRYIVMRATEDIWGFIDDPRVGSTLYAWGLREGWEKLDV